jgi:hypothetical protein
LQVLRVKEQSSEVFKVSGGAIVRLPLAASGTPAEDRLV